MGCLPSKSIQYKKDEHRVDTKAPVHVDVDVRGLPEIEFPQALMRKNYFIGSGGLNLLELALKTGPQTHLIMLDESVLVCTYLMDLQEMVLSCASEEVF